MQPLATFPSQKPYEQYSYSVEVPTQTMNKKLIIEQSSEGLKISVKSNDREISTIPMYMIVGLPKVDLVPKEFFNTCSASLVALDRGSKVYFSLPLKGGMFDDDPELAQLHNQFNQFMQQIQVHSDDSVRTYNAIPGMNDVFWNDSWCKLNIELTQFLNSPLAVDQKRESILNNIQNRIEFYKNKRQFLSQTQLALSDSLICIRASINAIETNITYSQSILNRLQEFENEMRAANPFGFSAYNPRLPSFMQDFSNRRFLVEDAKSKANAVSGLETEVCRKISECDKETFRLEKLFLAMKINQMQLDVMIQIDGPSIQRALANGEVINFPGQNGNGSYLD